MAIFSVALDYVMTWEDPRREHAIVPDEDALAISGINSNAYPAQFARISSLQQTQRGLAISAFYLSEFWLPMGATGLVGQDVADRVLDQGVNGGQSTGIVLLQRACDACGYGLEEDGVLGPLTLHAANNAPQDALLAAYRRMRVAHYQAIVVAKPELAQYLDEWLRRAQA